MEKKTRGFSPGVGGVLLLCALLVLCLLTIAVLTLVSARADLRLSEKNAAYIKAYYAAANTAEAYFSQADALCTAAVDEGVFIEEFEGNADFTGAAHMEDGVALSFSIPVGEDGVQTLETVILVSETGARRLRWQVVTRGEDDAVIEEDPLPVWPGE